jgi:hypothetical protein
VPILGSGADSHGINTRQQRNRELPVVRDEIERVKTFLFISFLAKAFYSQSV